MEFIVIAAVVTVVVALGGWYFNAYQTYQDATPTSPG